MVSVNQKIKQSYSYIPYHPLVVGMKRFTKQTTPLFYYCVILPTWGMYHSNGNAPCWIKVVKSISANMLSNTVFTLKYRIIQVVYLIDWTTLPVSHIHRDTSFLWAPSSENKGTLRTLSVGRTVYCDGIGICMHISMNLLIVANHINLELTCIEEVHSLAHDVYADKHNSIVSIVY